MTMSSANRRDTVNCRKCHKKWLKRADTILQWNGHCKSCAISLRSSCPVVKLQMSFRARVQILRQKGIPNAAHFTSERVRGSANYFWKGGITPLRNVIYNSERYKQWRNAVFKRDNYKCCNCGYRVRHIESHHIKPFSEYPECVFDIDNGQTLCVDCHRKTDSYGTRQLIKLKHKLSMLNEPI